MKIILDTNVIVSAFLKPRSKPDRIQRLAFQGELKTVCNEAILAEYLEVLVRPKFELNRERVEMMNLFLRLPSPQGPTCW